MDSLKKIKMSEEKDLLSTKEAVANLRASLEQKTEQAFKDFAKARLKSPEMAHHKYLD
jgi:hypothetical protein